MTKPKKTTTFYEQITNLSSPTVGKCVLKEYTTPAQQDARVKELTVQVKADIKQLKEATAELKAVVLKAREEIRSAIDDEILRLIALVSALTDALKR